MPCQDVRMFKAMNCRSRHSALGKTNAAGITAKSAIMGHTKHNNYFRARSARAGVCYSVPTSGCEDVRMFEAMTTKAVILLGHSAHAVAKIAAINAV